MTRPRLAALLFAVGVLGLAGCSSGSGPTPSSPPPSTIVETVAPTPTPTAPAPISTGPTTSASAAACPWASQAFISSTMGVRLGKVTVQASGGRTVGCRVYALQHPNDQCDATCLANEHLPGPSQPVIQIVTRRYSSVMGAHNAFVTLAEANRNAQQAQLGSTTGLCFQTDFYPADKGNDWACAVNKGAVELVVDSVDTTGSFGVSTLTAHVLAAI